MNIELAKRATACKHWRWMDGMRTQSGYRAQGRQELGLEESYEWDIDSGGYALFHGAIELPDLDDPATLGCLLALVRLAQGDCTIWTMVDVDCDEGAWLCTGLEVGEIGSGYSEAHALVAALEAAP
jgi:hypothetical protein